MTIPFFAYPVAAILAHPHWGSVGKAIVAPHIQLNSAVPVPVHRHRRHDDHAVHAALRAICGRRPRHRRRRAERRARRGCVGLDLREPRRELHHHRDRRNPVRARPLQRQQRGRRGEGARAVRRPLRRGAVRGRPARREPARGRDPARDRGLRDRRDVRLREGARAPPARGSGLRRHADGADPDRDGRRAHPRPAGHPPARARAGRERHAAAGDARLRLAARLERGADGQVQERPRVQRRRRPDGARDVGAVAAAARRHLQRRTPRPPLRSPPGTRRPCPGT